MALHEYLDKTGLTALWKRAGDIFTRKDRLALEIDSITKEGAGIEVTTQTTGGTVYLHIRNTAPMPSVVPVAQGGTGATTEDAAAQMIFQHAPEASPTQAGVVKTLSDQDFCEYMGIDYNPDDWS